MAITQPASAVTFRGIEFPLGEASFADEVVEYSKVYAGGMTQEEAYAKNWRASAQIFDDPTSVLGVANSSWRGNSVPIPQRDDFSLGKGGSITVKFTDNFLVGSDDDKDDLWIFEAGGLVEGMFVDISKNGKDWSSLGEIGGTQHAGIDLDAFGFTSDDTFSYVRVTDNGKNTYTEGWAGTDIDAIGAISSQDVPEPASILGLLTVGGFVTTSLVKRR
ncbi:MAG: PEP-CTERM sorting domain-containing protein [Leptolyngbyaceae cyanobacterium]